MVFGVFYLYILWKVLHWTSFCEPRNPKMASSPETFSRNILIESRFHMKYRLLNAIVSHCTTRGSGIISPASFNRERWNLVWANLPLNPAQEKNFSQIGQIVQEIWQNEFIPISSRWKNPDFFCFCWACLCIWNGSGSYLWHLLTYKAEILCLSRVWG